MLRRDADAAIARNSGCALGMRGIARMARRRRPSITGVGESANWSPKRSMLVAYGHGSYVSVFVQLTQAPEQTQCNVAVALAQQLV